MCRSWMGRPPRLPELHAVQAHPEVCEVFLAFKIPPADEMQRLLAQHAACCAHTGVRRRSCMRQRSQVSLFPSFSKKEPVQKRIAFFASGGRTHAPPPEAFQDCDATSFLHATPFLYPVPVKRHRGEPGHTPGHTGHTGTDGHTDHTDEPHNHPNPTTHPHDHAKAEIAAESTAARTAAGPEPTAPRGRLRRGRPQQTQPGRLPLPERLPVPARRRSAK